LFIDYLRYERNYSVHTVNSYFNDLSQFVAFLEEKVVAEGEVFDVERVDADIVRRWMMELMKQSLSPASVNRKLTSLQSFFKYLVRQDIVQKHPLKLVSGPKKSKALPYFIKEKDISNLLDVSLNDSDFEEVRNQLMIEMFYETGIRCSELVGIKNTDVDLDAMLLKVTGKRNKQRLIPFADRLKEMIVHYINVRGCEVEVDCSSFFVRKDGRPVSSAIVYYIVKKNLSGIPTLAKRSPHVLRHTFATSMLNDGAEMSAVSNLLGHSSLASTSVYTHVTFEELKKVYNAHPRAKK
jgi:integrase/recombinase XerC